MVSLEQAKGENGIVVVFECNHCPYVVASFSRMDAMAEYCASVGIGYVGINSNDANNYPDDSFEYRSHSKYAQQSCTLTPALHALAPSRPNPLPLSCKR